MPCPDAETLASFTRGALTGEALDAFERHLAGCEVCLRVIGELTHEEDEPDLQQAASLDPALIRRGESIGRYVVLDLLGSGGMGLVYSGYDPLLDRKVALKLLRPASGSEDSAGGPDRSRLLREAQALAQVSHPNVVAVYDVGIVGDQVFMAFERVEGSTLGEWLKPGRSWRAIRDAFVEAGRGLAAAHAAGVVHRDFKPDNVLVGSDGRIRVTDFGLARAQQRPPASAPAASGEPAAPLTRDGAVPGTPGFMPPEVLAGQRADARSDQFSFAVSLYESLYGAKPPASRELTPRGSRSPRSVASQARDSRLPSRLRRALVRGLEPRPQDRFPDMDALLAALLRDPMRRAAPFVAAALGLCLVVGALAVANRMAKAQARLCQGATASLSPVWNESRREAVHRAFEATKLPYAGEAWRASEQLLSAYASSWIAMRTESCEATRLRGEQSEEAMGLRMDCLDRRAREMSLVMDMLESADAKVVENALAVVRLPPLAACADVEGLRRPQRPPEDPARRARLDELRSSLVRAQALLSAGKPAAARDQTLPLVAVARELAYRPAEAEVLLVLGNAQSDAGDYASALRSLEDAAIAAEVGRELRLEATAYLRLAMVVGPIQRQFDQGELFCSHVRACLEQLGRDAEIEAELMDVEAQLAYLADRLDDALSLSTRAISLLERAAGADDRRVAALRSFQGYVLVELGKFPEAVQREEQALESRRRTFGASHPEVARSLTNLALVHMRLGNPERALTEFQEAHDIWSASFEPDHPLAGFARQGVADALLELGRVEEAHRASLAALETLTKGYGATHPRVASGLMTAGSIALERGALDEAQGDYERAVAITGTATSNPTRQGEPLTGVGRVLLARHRPREALVPLERAVQLLEQLHGAGGERADAHIALARALWEGGGDRARSRALARRALSEVQHLPHERSPRREIEAWLSAHTEPPGESP